MKRETHKPATPPTTYPKESLLKLNRTLLPFAPTASASPPISTRASLNPHRSPGLHPAPSDSRRTERRPPKLSSFLEISLEFGADIAPALATMGGKSKSGVSGAGILKPLASASPGCVRGAGAVYFFLVGSGLGVVAVFHASESGPAAGEWASAARWAVAALAASVGAHYLLAVISLLLLAASVWRLGKRCDNVEGLVRNADSTVQALRVGGVVCAVCGSKIQALKKGHLDSKARSSSKGCADKPFIRSLAAEFEQEATDKEEEDNAGEITDSEECNVQWLRKRLKEEKMLKEVALEELEKERRAAASAADEAMAKIACLRSEKALVEREAKQFREIAQQKQLYDRQVIESLQWVITRAGIQCWEPEASSDRAVSETSEDDRDRK
ncbi:hypothetical protein QOZ80_4AG0314690 [Eleusine coracana subsp. coracana]|nr:hypothetical protein QOZ80_4AG0314690 [Eleusine coracana subsp. coracana]